MPVDKLKEYLLEYSLEGRFMVCDLRNATWVNLSILDLAAKVECAAAQEALSAKARSMAPNAGA